MNIRILDTGFISTETQPSSQTQLGLSDRAGYSGSTDVFHFTLPSYSESIGGSVTIENKPIVNDLSEVNTTLVSSTNRVLKISFIMDKTLPGEAYDVNELFQFMRMERTAGMKLLYVDSITNTYKTIIEALGQQNIGGIFSHASYDDTLGYVSTTTPYLVGRVRNIQVSNSVTNNEYWRVSFNFILDKQV